MIYTELVTIESIPESREEDETVEGTRGEIHYMFRTKDDSGSADWFRTDLGTGLPAGGQVPCVAESGIESYDTSGVLCTLHPGTGSGTSDYATIIVSHFKAIGVNQKIRLHFEISNSRGNIGTMPKARVEVFSIRNRIPVVMNAVGITLAAIGQTAGSSFATFELMGAGWMS